MFDGLLKPKFYSKCKSCLKLIKTRLETIRKKRNAVQKFLKKDIADLLKNSLDYNAYGRAEGLLVEQNMSACYELVAKFVECISGHVRDLCKHKDCPNECKEAIPSLIYAAARFSDLPELRDLRTLFTEKFGNSLEPYISKEFIEKLRQDPPSKEMKIQLLHDLAQEFSIEWDSKGLEQKLYSTPLLREEKPKHDQQDDHGVVKLQKNNDDTKHTSKENNERDTLSQERKDISNAWWRVQGSGDTETTSDNSSQNDTKACSSSFENASGDDEAEEVKRPFSYRLVPPPYVKENKAESNLNVKENKAESNLKKTSEAPPERDSNIHDLHEPVVAQKKPIPRSVRRRPLKPPPDENTVTDSKTGANVSDSRVEEERIVDRLLMHYSKKQSPYESGTGKACPSQPVEYDKEQNRRHAKSNSSVTSLRGTSLTHKNTTSMETLKGHGRATSLVPEMLRTAGHVHPSLPDYDDFTARLAALRGN